MNVITIVSFIIGIFGTVLSAVGVWLAVRGNAMTRKAKTIDWGQLQTACKYIVKRLKKEFIPDVIITPGQKGGIISQLIVDNYELEIPIYTGFLVSKKVDVSNVLVENYFVLETTKWNVFLPKSIEASTEKKVLIVDDWVMSGDFLQILHKKLIEVGYLKQNVRSCSIATTEVAVEAKKAPDCFWKIVDAKECYFPWGKAR